MRSGFVEQILFHGSSSFFMLSNLVESPNFSEAVLSGAFMSVCSIVAAGTSVFLVNLMKGGQTAPRVLENFFLSFACAVMSCDSLGHLLPEVAHAGGASYLFFFLGVALTLGINTGVDALHRRYHQKHPGHHDGEIKNFGVANLLIELLHNFVDGLSLGMAYLGPNIASARAVTVAVAAHEIPQELSDGVVLLAAGLHPARLLWLNFLVSLTCPLGVVVAFMLQAALARKAYAATAALAAGSFTTFAIFIMGEQVVNTTIQIMTDNTANNRGFIQILTSLGPVLVAAWLGVALVHSVHEAAEGQLMTDGDQFSVISTVEAFFRPTAYVHDEM